MVGAVILFIVFIFIYVTILDIITVLFRLTGLTEEKARFQVVSLLTNSGYTTQESEIIVNSKVRRKLAKATMLFGYAFTVTIVSSIVNIFLSLDTQQQYEILVVVPFAALAVLVFYLIRRTTVIKTKFDLIIEKLGNKLMFGEHSNPVVFLDDYGTMVVAQIILNKMPHMLFETELSKSRLKEDYGILVMAIKSEDGKTHHAHGYTVLKPQDVIVVLGDKNKVRSVFEKV